MECNVYGSEVYVVVMNSKLESHMSRDKYLMFCLLRVV